MRYVCPAVMMSSRSASATRTMNHTRWRNRSAAIWVARGLGAGSTSAMIVLYNTTRSSLMSAAANLVYVAYGAREVLAQAHYAVLSALAFRGRSEVAIHLFTDQPDLFAGLRKQVTLRPLSGGEIRAWRGPGDYPFRVKIAAMAQMAQSSTGALIFADADTFFVAPLERLLTRLGPGRAVMHRQEYDVANFPTLQVRKFRRAVRRHAPEVELRGTMWNSGVVGVNPEQFGVFREMLRVIDQVSPYFKKALVEQYAVSHFLQRAARVGPCEDTIFHYWDPKPEYQREIEARLARWARLPLESTLTELRERRIALPPPPRKVRWW